MYALGFDPGGAGAFGWAALSDSSGEWCVDGSGTCSNARAAVDLAASHFTEPPIAVGADAPLYWVLDGDRKADDFVRKMVCAAGGKPGTVNHVNSLRGACLVQGAQVARLVHLRWPKVPTTEAHPKALLLISKPARQFVERNATLFHNEHERDAAIAAFAAVAYANAEPNWQDLTALELEPYFPGGASVSYWFPTERT